MPIEENKILRYGKFSNITREEITIKREEVKKICDKAFANSKIEDLIIEEGVKIGDKAFEDADIGGLCVLGESGGKQIEKDTFKNATIGELDLTRFRAERIIPGAFEGAKIGMLNLRHNQLEMLDTGIFKRVRIGKIELRNCPIKIIKEKAFDHANIGQIDLYEGYNIEEIETKAFSYSVMNTLFLTGKVTKIPKKVFDGSNIKRITLEFRIEEIEKEAFDNATIDSLTLGNNLKYITDGSFKNAKIKEQLSFSGKQIIEIEKKAFKNAQIKRINLSGNAIEEIEKDAFRDADIEELHLEGNNLEEIRKGAFGNANIKKLYLAKNKIKEIPTELLNNPTVKKLDLIYNKIREIKKNDFDNTQIKSCYLGGNLIDKIEEESFVGIKAKRLNFSGNKISELKNKTFKNADIKHLSFANNNLGLKRVNYAEAVESLDNSNIEENSVEYLDDMTETNIHENQIEEQPEINLSNYKLDIANDVFENAKINELDLENNCIAKVPIELFHNSKIETLDLARNMIQKIDAETFGDTKIENFNLSGNLIKEIEAESFVNTNIKSLDLSNNKLKEIGEKVFMHAVMEWVDLSNNNFDKIHKKAFKDANIDIVKFNECNITEIETEAFRHAKIENLEFFNTRIQKIKKDTFKDAEITKLSFYGTGIKEIEEGAFEDADIEEIDLSNNQDIRKIAAGAFRGLMDLKRISFSSDSLFNDANQENHNDIIEPLRELLINNPNAILELRGTYLSPDILFKIIDGNPDIQKRITFFDVFDDVDAVELSDVLNIIFNQQIPDGLQNRIIERGDSLKEFLCGFSYDKKAIADTELFGISESRKYLVEFLKNILITYNNDENYLDSINSIIESELEPDEYSDYVIPNVIHDIIIFDKIYKKEIYQNMSLLELFEFFKEDAVRNYIRDEMPETIKDGGENQLKEEMTWFNIVAKKININNNFLSSEICSSDENYLHCDEDRDAINKIIQNIQNPDYLLDTVVNFLIKEEIHNDSLISFKEEYTDDPEHIEQLREKLRETIMEERNSSKESIPSPQISVISSEKFVDESKQNFQQSYG